MTIPAGTVPITGPILDTTGGDISPSTLLRDLGVISFRGGAARKVSEDGNRWESLVLDELFQGDYDNTRTYYAGHVVQHPSGQPHLWMCVVVGGSTGAPEDGSLEWYRIVEGPILRQSEIGNYESYRPGQMARIQNTDDVYLTLSSGLPVDAAAIQNGPTRFLLLSQNVTGLTAQQQHDLSLVPGLLDKTSDLEITRERDAWRTAPDFLMARDIATPSNATLEALTYSASLTYNTLTINDNYLILRGPTTGRIKRVRVVHTEQGGDIRYTEGSHFVPLYTSSNYRYWGYRIRVENGVVLTIQEEEQINISTRYVGDVEQAYPVPDLELLTDDIVVLDGPPIWSAGPVTGVRIGSFTGQPSDSQLVSHSYGDQLNFNADPTHDYIAFRINKATAVPPDVRNHRIALTDTINGGTTYIRGAYFKRLHDTNTNSYWGRSVLVYEGLRIEVEASDIQGSTTDYQGTTLSAKSSVDTTDLDGLLSGTDDTVQDALETLDDVEAEDIPVDATGFVGNGVLQTGDINVQRALQSIHDNTVLVKHGLQLPNVATINAADRDKLHVVEDASGNLESVQFVEYVLSRFTFRMMTESFSNQDDHASHGWSSAESAGLFEPIGNIVRIYTNDSGSRHFQHILHQRQPTPLLQQS